MPDIADSEVPMAGRFLVLLLIFLVYLPFSTSASDDPIQYRKKLMREAATVAKASAEMMRGNIPFDPLIAEIAMDALETTATSYGDFFPDGSNVGDTNAADAIWDNPAGFESALSKFRTDVTTAISAKPNDIESFKASMGIVLENCKSCHEKFKEPE